MDLHAILGVPPDADEETIRTAYRILARRYHPDRGAGSSAERFRQVNEAYRELMNRSIQPAAQPAVRGTGPDTLPQEDPRVFGTYSGRPWVRRRRPEFFTSIDQLLDELDDWLL